MINRHLCFETSMHGIVIVVWISGDTKRKKKLLKQISELQEFNQSGIPIVYRFLAEYISTRWNGSDFFLEILRLLAYLPITEFEGKDYDITQPGKNYGNKN